MQMLWCYKRGCLTTLGGDGVFGAGGGVSLGAVAAGVLQRVSAALLLLHTQSSGQNHGQSTGCRGQRLPVLGHKANTQKISAHLHIPLTPGLGLIKRKPSPWRPHFLGQLSLGGDHQIAPADWAEPPVLSSYPQTPSYAAECWPKMSRRNLTWPSPAAAEGKPKLPSVKLSSSSANSVRHVRRRSCKFGSWTY